MPALEPIGQPLVTLMWLAWGPQQGKELLQMRTAWDAR
jgi:hypothetical protein